jgi:acyl-CoA reductase-like NAD-dependent aldehyde dehydrogenase
LPGADLERVARAVKFGLAFNGGATCIGPRRLFVHRNQIDAFHEALVDCLKNHQTMVVHPAARPGIVSAIDAALKDGAGDLLGHYGESDFRADGKLRPVILDRATVEMDLMRADLFGPVAGLAIYEDVERVVQWINECPYGLAASVFGPEQESVQLANRLQVGTVVVNDLVAPTADPRLAFGGRRESGFGVTRGAEGLLEMTVPRVVTVRRRGPTPHLDPATSGEGDILAGALAIQHGKGIRRRFSGLHRLIKGVRLSRSNKE